MSRLLEGDDTRLPRVDDTFTQKTVNDARKRKWRMPQRKQTKRSGHPAGEELLDEMLWEILIRLPVESLARFKLVSKVWYTIISQPVFVRAHLQRSKQKQHHNPSSFLITPQIYLDSNPSGIFSTNIRFFQWSLQEDDLPKVATKVGMSHSSSAMLLHGRHFPAGEFGLVSQMAHCDGLVLLPTDTNAYVFNPATRDGIALPRSHHNVLQRPVCLPIGLGLDVSTGTYKVARSFFRSCDYNSVAMGMEVITINCGEGSWRETLVDPPYLILCPQTAIHCKGCLFYFIDRENQPCSPRGLLRFSLQDETFGITPLLNNLYPTVEDEDIVIHELGGELCATFFCKSMQRVLISMTRDILVPEWECHYVMNVSDQCLPMASLSNGGILLRRGHCLFRYYMKDHGVKENDMFDIDELRFLGPSEDTLGHAWENLFWFDLLYYTPSLVPVTPKASLHAS
ncbi:hypothetical protein VPH35_051448 [Triticum aestivum]|uniref:putative F-box protein At2g02030 isoform X1 n=2 Tax=Triticum TaxID=4564 RepID=UPI0008428396|nr:putative F-box protein At2g02030 isoform X1 [Triticum aestivum]